MNVLFICTGNTCRSAMAEGLFRVAAKAAGSDAHAISAGMSVFSPEPAAEFAVKAASELGADISGHQARAVNATLVGTSDAVYCMTRAHLDVLTLMFPQYASKFRMLSPQNDIEDPFGGTYEQYKAVALQIKSAVDALVIKQ